MEVDIQLSIIGHFYFVFIEFHNQLHTIRRQDGEYFNLRVRLYKDLEGVFEVPLQGQPFGIAVRFKRFSFLFKYLKEFMLSEHKGRKRGGKVNYQYRSGITPAILLFAD